jgi:tellurite resistance protein
LFLKIKFYLSWWAYTFPLAAFSLATVLMYHITSLIVFKILAIIIFFILVLFICILSWKTIQAMGKKEICIEED